MLSTLRFIFFTIVTLALIFGAVVITILNTYKPILRAYINDRFVGYFLNEQQFDEVYNDLVAEKQSIDPNVKVYLESEPTFETSYIRDSLLSEQNIYTNLRAEIKTEFTIYNVAVDGENKMTFSTEDDANKYAENLKSEVKDLNAEVKMEKVSKLGETTSIERADAILKDIVDRNKPIEIPKPVVEQPKVQKYNTSVYNGPIVPDLSGTRAWPTVSRYINCDYWGYYGHNGVDLKASVGTDVYAYMGGTVTHSGWDASGYGNCVKINHGNGVVTIYGHCSQLCVSAGEQVVAGQLIALSGNTGNTTGPHLHFEVRVNGVAINPWVYLNQI